MTFELRKELYRRTLRLDLATIPPDHDRRPDEPFHVTDVNVAANGVQNVYGMVICEPMKIVVCLAGAAWVSWQLLLLTMISAPLAGYAVGLARQSSEAGQSPGDRRDVDRLRSARRNVRRRQGDQGVHARVARADAGSITRRSSTTRSRCGSRSTARWSAP